MTMIDPVTLALVKSALDAGELRQVAYANNIANANTPGYQPFKVLFEERLGGIRQALSDGTLGDMQASDMPVATMVVDPGAPAPSLDSEVAAASENALHYQALTRALSQQYTLINLAMSGGGDK
jgi:flagellar basal-body rod protein FlgB